MNKKIAIQKMKSALQKIFLLCILCCPSIVFAQNRVSGKVVDPDGKPVVGVNIVEKGASNGVVTDNSGSFSLDVRSSASVLQISFTGYETQEITAGARTEINVTLLEDVQALDEVVVVGYGTQRKSTLTGSVASIKSEQLTIAPVGNVTNALTGKLPGLIAVQQSGMPGSDQANLNIRGFGSPLVIVDGIEASLTDLDANQIESVSILKDGAASIYGARAGNGVLLVTTKRGIVQRPTITFNASYTMQGPTQMPGTQNAGQWTQIRREQHLNSGRPEATAPFTAEEVEKYSAGDDPAYPSSDWAEYVFRDWAPLQNHNLSIRGGSEKLKYLGFFGYQDQGTMIKENGGGYSRYNVQSNVDAAITSRLNLSVDLFAVYEFRKFTPRVAGSNYYWQDLYYTPPWVPTTLPDPTKLSGGATEGTVYMNTNMDVSGYKNTIDRDLRGTITLSYNLPFIEGLIAKAFVNYRDWQQYNKTFSKPYTWYTYNYANDTYTLIGGSGNKASLTEDIVFNRQLIQQYSLNYDHTFNDAHHVTALAMFESTDYSGNNFSAGRREFMTPAVEQLFAGSTDYQTANGSASEWGRASVIGRINYSYRDKYLLETILRADASAKFPKETRWGYFPGVSLGWVISKEGFMEDIDLIEFLKLRASYGSSGNDGVGNFQYLTGYQIGWNVLWDDVVYSGLYPRNMANPLLTWEEMKVYNAGLDFSLLKRAIYGTMEVFYRTRDGIPASRNNSVPSTFGASLPVENINSLNDRGFEISLGTAKTKGNFMYDISANISWSRAKYDHYEEPEYEDPDQKRQNQKSGQWTDMYYGYVSEGVFTSQDEIDELPYTYDISGVTGNASLRPGDVRLANTNGDDKLDWRDRVEIGKGTLPHWFYGLTAACAYRGFDFTALFQGAFGYSTNVGNIGHYFATDTYYKLRWTEENNHKDVLVPRPGGVYAGGDSDYLLKSTAYLRLKNVSMGYTLPKKWTEKAGIAKVRLHVSGTNLFTFSTLNKHYVDPEMPSGQISAYYPQQRTISFGLNLVF
jgi:TonB-linked SusC/RagA family outer membrane protein